MTYSNSSNTKPTTHAHTCNASWVKDNTDSQSVELKNSCKVLLHFLIQCEGLLNRHTSNSEPLSVCPGSCTLSNLHPLSVYLCLCSENIITVKVSNFLRGERDYSCPLITKWNRTMIYGAIRGAGWN